MIRVFRKIRKKLLGEGRLAKYFFYLTGEVVLVVIGVLIALAINNANERSKSRAKIQNILLQVQAELKTNLDSGIGILEELMSKDSLIHLVMNDLYTSSEDIRKNRDLVNLVNQYEIFNIQDNAFKALIAESENIPVKYDSILIQLNDIYVSRKSWVENADSETQRIVLRHWDWEISNTDWFSDKYFRDRELPDEQMEFYMESSYYKNVVYDYFNSALENQYPRILKFCTEAYRCYDSISEQLAEEGVNKNNVQVLPYDYVVPEDLVGDYLGDFGESSIYEAENHLIFKNNGVKSLVIPVGENKFIGAYGMFCYLEFNEEKQLIGFRGRYGNEGWSFRKIY
ncbi:MAG: hypothetical protein AAFY36_04605 [Bacteroidota bacterium]